MAYKRHFWVAPEGSNLNRFKKVNETTDSVDLIQNPLLTNIPTPFSAEWMNEMEKGIEAATKGEVLEDLPDGSNDGFITTTSTGRMKLIGFERLQQRVVGEARDIKRAMTSWELAKARLLELKYQIIEIALYQELCDFMYVGDANNDTADWWYKCDEDGTRNVNGLYMRVEDGRGLFRRDAGANAVKTAANNTPYDGNEIGSFNKDKFLRHAHQLSVIWINQDFTGFNLAPSTNICWRGDAGVRFTDETGDNETSPASVSCLACISY